MSPDATSASLTIVLLLAASPSFVRTRVDGLKPEQTLHSVTRAPMSGAVTQERGCRVQYEPRTELTLVEDPRMQAILRQLLTRFGITERVLLCADIPLQQKNFAEMVRRSDGQALVAINKVLLEFNDAEITGMLAHELAHLMAGDLDRPRPASTAEYLREERDADLNAARLVGREAMYAAVARAYRESVVLGFESKTHVLKKYTDQRLDWIRSGGR